jgi:hypothetical protein
MSPGCRPLKDFHDVDTGYQGKLQGVKKGTRKNSFLAIRTGPHAGTMVREMMA